MADSYVLYDTNAYAENAAALSAATSAGYLSGGRRLGSPEKTVGHGLGLERDTTFENQMKQILAAAEGN